MATTTRSEYLQSRFQRLIDLGDGFCVNFGDPTLYRMLRQLRRGQDMTWEEGDKFPAVSHRYYGTVSLWWVIVIYNGVMHPMEAEIGDQFFVPDLAEINSVIEALRQDQLRRRVTRI